MSFKKANFFLYTLTLFCFSQLCSSNMSFSSKYSTIKIDSGAFCLVTSPLTIDNGIIQREEFGLIRGAPINFINSTFIDNGNKAKITGTIDVNNFYIILTGGNSFSGRNGSIYQPVHVSGQGNLISGNLTIGNDILLQDSNTTVSINLISNLNGNIYLNSGSICLMENNLKLNDGNQIHGPGLIKVCSGKLVYGAIPLTFNEDLYIDNAQDIQFNANVVLQKNWTFSGNSTIEGNANSLYLQGGKIIVERGSSLLIKDIVLHDVQDGNLFCLDNNATITFQNALIYLSNDYTFSLGKFVTSDQVTFEGNNKFIYQSPMTSTITSKSNLFLDQGVTFSYDPPFMKKDLIEFEDAYSVLTLNGATLHATMTGMQLTKGTLIVNKNSFISAEKNAFVDVGITIGNDNEEDDLYCQNLNGSSLEIIQGSLKYRNISTTAWIMENNVSSIAVNASSNLYLYQDLNIAPGFLHYKGCGGFFYVKGKQCNGPLLVSGYINYQVLK